MDRRPGEEGTKSGYQPVPFALKLDHSARASYVCAFAVVNREINKNTIDKRLLAISEIWQRYLIRQSREAMFN
jgi:hypothetical protein